MREDRARQSDRARRIAAALEALRGYRAARERERQPVPPALREAIAHFGEQLGSIHSESERDEGARP